jgi:hypothetical protein
MKPVTPKPQRCAIYARKSTEQISISSSTHSMPSGRPARLISRARRMRAGASSPNRYDDGGLSGASLDRPGRSYLTVEYSVSRRRGRLPCFTSMRTARLGKTPAFYGVKAGYRGIGIETVILGVAGDDSRNAAGNFDDIGVGHVSFLPLALVSTQSSGHTSRMLCQFVEHLRLTVSNANSRLTRSAGANVSFKRCGKIVWLRHGPATSARRSTQRDRHSGSNIQV